MNYRRRVARVTVMPMPILGHFISLLITGYNLQVYIKAFMYSIPIGLILIGLYVFYTGVKLFDNALLSIRAFLFLKNIRGLVWSRKVMN